MECFPACRTCTGLCQQPAPERSQSKAKTRKKPVAPERMAGYIAMICGHYTTMEAQIATPGFRKSRRRYWCEKCGKWQHPFATREKVPETVDERTRLF